MFQDEAAATKKLTLNDEQMFKRHLIDFHNQQIDLPWINVSPHWLNFRQKYLGAPALKKKDISNIQREGEKSNPHVSHAQFWDGVTEKYAQTLDSKIWSKENKRIFAKCVLSWPL